MPTRPRSQAVLMRLAACAGLAGALAACQSDGIATGSIQDYPHDVRARHPIVLADRPRSLDVFATGAGHIDPRQVADVQAFVLEYRRYGRGGLSVQVPGNLPPAEAAATARTVAGIRRIAADGGVPALAITGYPAAMPGVASAIRLSFARMQAKVAGDCGLWPEDLGAGDFKAGFGNGPYYNLGCAMQSNVAAQVADPVDLVRGQTESRSDSVRRARVIDAVREGKDPSVSWRQDGQASVKQQVGQ
jgi:pilus assembly protein CpaD